VIEVTIVIYFQTSFEYIWAWTWKHTSVLWSVLIFQFC